MELAEDGPLLSSDLDVSLLPSSSLSSSPGIISFTSTPSPQPPRTPVTVRATQKHDGLSRPATSPAPIPDHRDFKTNKEHVKAEEVSEYVHHGVDPSAPIYEITHAIPDALVLKCADCQRFARVQPHLPGMELLPGPGDRGVHFKCSRCGGGQQVFRHSEKTWLEITLTSLYNLELQDKHKEGRRFFHVRQEICSFADRNWDVICLGRTRTPTWWATLNAQITTRTDLFETSKHGSGNWALRHSNITHPVQPGDNVSLDPSREIPPEKPATMKLNATAIVAKKVFGERRFFLVTLEGSPTTVWRESTHPCFKSGELIRKFMKVEATGKDSNARAPGKPGRSASSAPSSSSKSASSSSMLASSVLSGTAPLSASYGVFTEKVVKTPSRLSRRQQSKHDAAVAAAQAAAVAAAAQAAQASSAHHHHHHNNTALSHTNGTPKHYNAGGAHSTAATGASPKHLSPMADSYRKTAKLAAGLQTGPHHHHHQSPSSTSYGKTTISATAYHTQQQANLGSPTANSAYASSMGGVAKLANGTILNSTHLKLAQNPQPMRCHQCNRRQLSRPKPGQEFVFCTHTVTKVQGDVTVNMACTQSYCRTCIDLIYHEHPLEDEHETATWICPACRQICTCATCNDYSDPSAPPQPNLVITTTTTTASTNTTSNSSTNSNSTSGTSTTHHYSNSSSFAAQAHTSAVSNSSSSSASASSSSSTSSLSAAYAQKQYQTVSSSSASSTGHQVSNNASSGSGTYDSSEASPGGDSSSTTTSYTTNTPPSTHATPNGSVSLSPNVSMCVTATGFPPNGTSTSPSPLNGGNISPTSSSSALSSGSVHGQTGGKAVTYMRYHDKGSAAGRNCDYIAARINRKTKLRLLIRTQDTVTSSGSYKWITEKMPKDGSAMRLQGKLDQFDEELRFTIPAFDPNPQPVKKEAKAPTAPVQPSPHNTRSNSGTRSSSQHPLSLYTQTLVSRGPSNRKRQLTSPANYSGSSSQGEIMVPKTLPQSHLYISAAAGGHILPQQMVGAGDEVKHHSMRRRYHPEGMARFHPDGHLLTPATHYGGSLPSPTGDYVPDRQQFMMRAKGKRPYSDLTASTGDILRRRDPYGEPSLKRRAGPNSSIDDMGDLMGELASPRIPLGHFSDDEDGAPMRSASLHHHPHHHQHHHHHHHHHAPHHLGPMDDGMSKDHVVVGVVGDHLTVDMPTMPGSVMMEVDPSLHPALLPMQAPTASINPAQILEMTDFLSPQDGGNMDALPAEGWSEGVAAYADSSSYF